MSHLLRTKMGFHCRVIFICVNIPSYRETPKEQINVVKTELSIDGTRGKHILNLEYFKLIQKQFLGSAFL